jgi:lysophospholipase L1-like esterase
VRFLALGDSYTIGEGTAERDRWPNQLAAMLRARGANVRDPEIIARTAWTTDELAEAISAASPTGPYGLVSLLIGVNDHYRGRSLEQFAGGFIPLLQRAISLAGNRPAHVVVISIPDWGATPFADREGHGTGGQEDRSRAVIAREIDAFNAHAASIARRLGAVWHDVTELSRKMLSDPALVAQDGLHPSGAMYRAWAESLMPVVAGMIGREESSLSA